MKILAHAHTNYSRDGTLSPAKLADLASRRGFGAVLLSDHYEHLDRSKFDRLVAECDAVSSCTLVPGYERSWRGYHLCAFGTRIWSDEKNLSLWANSVRSSGGLICLAHPARYAFRIPNDILAACDAVEVWNSKRPYDGGLAPNPAASRLLNPGLLALAGQDFHRRLDLTSVGLQLNSIGTHVELIEEIRSGCFFITSRWLEFEREPPQRLRSLLSVWQRSRPYLWAGPLAAFRWLRRRIRNRR